MPGSLSECRLGRQEARREALLGSGGCLGRQEARREAVLGARRPVGRQLVYNLARIWAVQFSIHLESKFGEIEKTHTFSKKGRAFGEMRF